MSPVIQKKNKFFVIKNLIKYFFLFKKKNSNFTQYYNENNNILLIVYHIMDNDCGKMIADFLNYLKKKGFNVNILTCQNDIPILFNENINIITKKNLSSKAVYNKILLKTTILKICRSYHIDVLCVCDAFFLKTALKCKTILNIPIIYWIFYINNNEANIKHPSFNKIKKIDLILSISNEISSFLLDSYNINEDKIKQLTLSVDNEIYDSKKVSCGRVREAIRSIDSDIGRKKIFFCYYDYRELHLCYILIKVISMIYRDDFVCVVSGNFKQLSIDKRNELFSYIKKYKVENRIKIINRILDKSAIISSSYAVICIQQDEGSFIKSVCEAGAMKKPAIIINKYAYTENLINGKTGFCVKCDNINELRNAIVKMLDMNEHEYREMCENAYNYIMKHFIQKKAFENICNDIITLIDKKINHELKSKKKYPAFY